jgi:ABC-2 type transport system ATP-binding protein
MVRAVCHDAGMLELDSLHKRFADTVALDGLSMHVPRGQMFGFVGTNGAGKTTAMRIVLGVLSADSGTVRWEGSPVDARVRAQIGYMPEERGLYPKMRVRDHLIYLARLHGARPADAAAASERWMAELGVGARADDRVESLSLGNQQRVQLAAALVHDPEVLVLDEPFSGLDPVGVDVLAGVLRTRVDAGGAVVFSSHQLDLVERLCDAVGIIQAGRLVASGTVDELRGHDRVRRLRVQVRGPVGWADGLAGVRVAGREDDEVLLELDRTTDDQMVLAAARAAGPVVAFAPVTPSLAELFREVVRG